MRQPLRAWVLGTGVGVLSVVLVALLGYAALSVTCGALNEEPGFCFEVPEPLFFAPSWLGALSGGIAAAVSRRRASDRGAVVTGALVAGILLLMFAFLQISLSAR